MNQAETKPASVERVYRATLDEVWDLWTTRDGFASWWGPQGFRADVHELDARQGGTLRYDMVANTPETIAAMQKMGQPTSHPTHARFAEVSPKSRIVIRNVIDFIPGVAPYESDIVVELSQSGDRVRMVVTFGPMHSPEITRMQHEGFGSQLTKLDERFGGSSS